MKALLARIHARVGDLWWYSAMIFVACRCGDVINAFIGLWLVPKYVGPDELGAVLPLQQLTSFLTVPLGVVAIVFAKQVNTYAAHGEYGKVKGFVRDVLGISAALFLVCIVGAYLIMPFFYERLRIESGLLTALILASGFVASIGSLVSATQQGLKRFKTMSLMNLVSAPVRLVTMLVAMPIRALSGYLLGQTTPGLVTAALATYDTHRVLKPHALDTSWRKDWKSILNYTWPIALLTIFGACNSTAYATLYRQRLPEIESAAYYMLTRFSELANYFSASITIIIFPLAAEAHAKGKESVKLLQKSLLGVFVGTILLTIALSLTQNLIFNLTPTWATYSNYAYLLPWLTLATGTGSMLGLIITFELANNRFRVIAPVQIYNAASTLLLIALAGYSFFDGILPPIIVDFMRRADIAHLDKLIYIANVWNFIQIGLYYFYYKRKTK